MDEQVSPLSDSARHVLIAVNPKAGTRSARVRVDRLVTLLCRRGLEAEVATDLGEIADRAQKSHADGQLRALVGVGGDGTAAELVNRTAAGLPITMLPAGNENLLARYLHFGTTPEEVCDTIADGVLMRLDAARANNRVFLLMISCGFDAEVVRRVHENRSGHICKRTYAKPILQTIRSYEYPELTVYWDDDTDGAREHRGLPSTAKWLFAFNLPCYGGGFRLAPKADGTDGQLDICAFEQGSLWHGLRLAAAVVLGWHERMADCATGRVRKMRITAQTEVPYQLDGDPGGMLPVDVEVLPGRLALVVPAERAAMLWKKTKR